MVLCITEWLNDGVFNTFFHNADIILTDTD